MRMTQSRQRGGAWRERSVGSVHFSRCAVTFHWYGMFVGPNKSKNDRTMKKCRLIYNWDGFDCPRMVDYPASRDKMAELIFGAIIGTPVDTLCFCSGTTDLFVHQSKVAETILDVPARFHDRTDVKNLKLLFEQGTDPLRIAVEYGHKAGLEVFGSFRMNDVHHWREPEGMLASRFWKEHRLRHCLNMPEKYWRTGMSGALDYKYAEIRERRLAVIKEMITNYDIDGMELDFRSGPFVFSPSEAGENAPIMTEFLRTIKKMRKDNSFLLSVLVPHSPLLCRELGLDLETWIKEGLLEFVAFGERDLNLPIDQFKKIARGTPCGIYPCIGAWSDPKAGEMTRDMYRAWALNFYEGHVDGLYVFNLYNLNKNTQREILNEIGAPETIQNKRRHHAWYIFPDIPGERVESKEEMLDRHVYFAHLNQLPSWGADAENGTWKNVTFKIAENISAENKVFGKLCFKLTNVAFGDEIKIKINNNEITGGRIKKEDFTCGRAHPPCGPYCQYIINLDDGRTVKRGENELSLFVAKKAKDSGVQTDLFELEVMVNCAEC